MRRAHKSPGRDRAGNSAGDLPGAMSELWGSATDPVEPDSLNNGRIGTTHRPKRAEIQILKPSVSSDSYGPPTPSMADIQRIALPITFSTEALNLMSRLFLGNVPH